MRCCWHGYQAKSLAWQRWRYYWGRLLGVADPTVQGKGVGSRLWDAVIDWGREQGALKLEFTSRPEREAAQRFYLKKGAVVRSTNAFAKRL